MAGQLIPLPELAPPIPSRLTAEQSVAAWMQLMDFGEQLVLAGLRREIGPDGDLEAAYRQWYARQMEEHDRMMLHLMEGLARCGARLAR